MKFGHQLEANIFEEWRDKYLQYKWLKHQIADLFPDPEKDAKKKKKKDKGKDKSKDKEKKKDKHKDKATTTVTSAPADGVNESTSLLMPTITITTVDDKETKELSTSSSQLLSPTTETTALLRRASQESITYGAVLEARDRATLTHDECQQLVVALLTRELDKIDAHYQTIERQLTSSYAALKIQVGNIPPSDRRALDDMRRSFISLLRRATMLVNFVGMNILAFEKISKNFDKRSKVKYQKEFMAMVRGRHFATSALVNETLIPDTYQLYARVYEHGDVEAAKVALLANMTESEQTRSDMCQLGLKCGFVIVLLFWNFALLLRPSHQLTAHDAVVGPIYRSLGLIIVAIWMWGCNVYYFTKHRMSYVFIFEFNPRDRLTHYQIWHQAANLSVVYLINSLFLLSHYDGWMGHRVTRLVYPGSLFVFFLLKFFVPGQLFAHWSARKCMLETIGHIMVSPFGRVRFRDSYIADVICSMVKILVDMEYNFCIYLSGLVFTLLQAHQLTEPNTCQAHNAIVVPFICAVPLFWRFLQCMKLYYLTSRRTPHLFNALKYALAHSVVIITAFHSQLSPSATTGWTWYRVAWLSVCLGSSLYTYYWDVRMDWGLCAFDNSSHPFLRNTLMYHTPAAYYWAIASDLFLRLIWVVNIIPFPFRLLVLESYEPIFLPLVIFCELFRRFQWSLFRVEWEHLKNGSGFRKYDYVPIFFDNSREKAERQAHTQGGYGVVTEVVLMIAVLLVVAILGIVVQ